MSIMTHTGGGSSIVLRVGKGRYMFIRGMLNGGLVGGGYGISPRKRWSGEPTPGKLNIDAKRLVKRLF